MNSQVYLIILYLNQFLKEYKISIIRLITPTTSEKRLKTILKSASGFLYYVSIMGITGTKIPSLKKVRKAVSVIKKNTEIPVVVGFGINNSSQILEISKFADGSVVGSSIVKIIEDAYEKKKSREAPSSFFHAGQSSPLHPSCSMLTRRIMSPCVVPTENEWERQPGRPRQGHLVCQH